MKKRLLLLSGFIAVSAVSSTTFAQPANPPKTAPAVDPAPPAAPAPPPAPTLAESLPADAKADYESGKILVGDGDWAGALVKFTSAYDKSKDARLLWNMAACEKYLRHYAKSLKLVRRYQAEAGEKLSDADKKEATDFINAIEPLTAKLKITVNEPGAEVSVDDEVVGTSPVDPWLVDLGTRKLRIKKEGFTQVDKDVVVGGNAEVAADVTLTKIVHEGKLVVRSSLDSTVTLDNQVIGSGTVEKQLPSGGHMLRVTAPGKIAYQTEVFIQDNQTRDVGVTLDNEPSRGVPVWAWIAGGVVVAGGLTTAGYFIFKSDNTYEGPSGNLSPGVVQAARRFR